MDKDLDTLSKETGTPLWKLEIEAGHPRNDTLVTITSHENLEGLKRELEAQDSSALTAATKLVEFVRKYWSAKADPDVVCLKRALEMLRKFNHEDSNCNQEIITVLILRLKISLFKGASTMEERGELLSLYRLCQDYPGPERAIVQRILELS